MAKTKNFSIILPTYSGQQTIAQTFESLLAQKTASFKYELIVMIDGPSQAIREISENYKRRFESKKIDFRINQFKQNKGRFAARLAAAKLASYEQLFFMEDRVYLANDYFVRLEKINHSLMLSNVLEDKVSSNFISDTLTIIRRAVYGRNWGQDFKDYEIGSANFEKSPKGMASLWVGRGLFLEACAKFKNDPLNTKDSNDDTGLLRIIVDQGHKIYRSNSLKIYYQPRTGLIETIKHLFARGPKFVDYYLKPGTRFFSLLAAFYLFLILVISLAFLKPICLIILAIIYIMMILVIMLRAVKTREEVLLALFGIPVVVLIFFAGVLKGSLLLVVGRSR